jgi:hypothetical protein
MVEKSNPEIKFYAKKSTYHLSKSVSIPAVGTDHNKAPLHYSGLLCASQNAPD